MGLTVTANRLNELYGIEMSQPENPGNAQNDVANPNAVVQADAQAVKGESPGAAHAELTRLMRLAAGESFSNFSLTDLGTVEKAFSGKVYKTLTDSVKVLESDLRELSAVKGSDLAKPSHEIMAKIEDVIDRQMQLSERLTAAANSLGPKKSALRGKLYDLALKCDSRASELGTLLFQLAALEDADDVSDAKDQLMSRSVGDMMKGMSGTMHGNDDLLKTDAARDFGGKLVELSGGDGNKTVSGETFDALKTSAGTFAKSVPGNMDTSLATALQGRLGKLDNFGEAAARIAVDNAFANLPEREYVGILTNPRVSKHIAEVDKTGFISIVSEFYQVLEEQGDRDPKWQKRLYHAYDEVQTWLKQNPLDKVKGGMPLSHEISADLKNLYLKVRSEALTPEPDDDPVVWRAMKFWNKMNVRLLDANMSRSVDFLLGFNQDGLRYTADHIKDIQDIGRNLTPEDLPAAGLTGQDILSVMFDGHSLSVALETRLHGASPQQLDRDMESGQVQKVQPIGSGTSGDIYRIDYTDTNGETKSRVFKPELNGRVTMSTLGLGHADAYGPGYRGITTVNVNTAVNKVADCIGFGDLVVKSAATVHDGKFGLTMDFAKGVTANDFTWANAAAIEKLKKDNPAGLRTLQNGLLRQTVDLQWLDLLVGQGDRHHKNYMIDADFTTGKVKVTGIDNDMSFPAYRTALTKIRIDPKSARGKRFQKKLEGFCQESGLDPKARKAMLNEYLPGYNKDKPAELDVSRPLPHELECALCDTFGFHSIGLPPFMSETMCGKLIGLGEQPGKLEELKTSLESLLPKELATSTLGRLKEMIGLAKTYRDKGKVLKDDEWIDHLNELSRIDTCRGIKDPYAKEVFLDCRVNLVVRDCPSLFGVEYD